MPRGACNAAALCMQVGAQSHPDVFNNQDVKKISSCRDAAAGEQDRQPLYFERNWTHAAFDVGLKISKVCAMPCAAEMYRFELGSA